MENNDWIVFDRDLYDVICPPQKGCLKIISKDQTIDFQMEHRDMNCEKFRENIRKRCTMKVDPPRLPDDTIKIMANSMGITTKELKKQMKAWEEKHQEDPQSRLETVNKNLDRFISQLGNPEVVYAWILSGKIKHRNENLVIGPNYFEFNTNRIYSSFISNGGKFLCI